jgi:hypothetical protein
MNKMVTDLAREMSFNIMFSYFECSTVTDLAREMSLNRMFYCNRSSKRNVFKYNVLL